MKPKRDWEEGHEKGETARSHWGNILDGGSLLLRGESQVLYLVLLRTEKVLHRFRQVGDKSPVATFGGWEELFWDACCLPPAGACVHQECEYVAGCRSYQLVVPTSWLPNSAGYKLTHDICWKQNLEQNCCKDIEIWGGKLKKWASQIVFATFLLSCSFGKERKLCKWIARLSGWYLWEEMIYAGLWPRILKNQVPTMVECVLQTGVIISRQHLTFIYSYIYSFFNLESVYARQIEDSWWEGRDILRKFGKTRVFPYPVSDEWL